MINSWDLLAQSALLLLLGFLLAGLIRAFLTERALIRIVGRSGPKQVLRASLIGLPLPLCSCSVLPVVHQLRRAGVSKGGSVAFLIATPESGVDSILLTYSLTDPLLTIMRPVTAFITALTAGFMESSIEKRQPPTPSADEVGGSGGNSGPTEIRKTVVHRIVDGVRYAATDLVSDLSPYLLFGYLLAGLVMFLLGPNSMSLGFGSLSGWVGYLAAILIGLPLYICATSSTPLAPALLVAGFSPGAVLVFLLVGPATNLVSLVVLSKILPGWSLIRYLTVVVTVAVAMGILTDQLYAMMGISLSVEIGEFGHQESWPDILAAAFLGVVMLYYSARKLLRRLS